MRYLTAEQYAQLPDWLQKSYKEVTDGEKKGQFELAKPPEGYTPKEKVDEFRDNNITLLRRLEALEAKGNSSEETEALRAKLAEFEQQKLQDEGKWDEWRANWERQSAEKIAAKDKDLEKLRGELKQFKLNDRIKAAGLKAGIHPESIDDVVGLLADKNIKLGKEDAFEIFDFEGVPYQGDINQFFSELYKEKRPLYYDGANPQGGGASQSAQTPQVKRDGKKTISSSDKDAFSQNLEAIANGEVSVVMGG